MMNRGGTEWKKYNDAMRDEVLKNQSPDGTWKDVGGGKPIPHGATFQGGGQSQLYRTVLVTLMMEVYYRFLPSAAH
jgi:hypothetical protein